jgi:hypothetical protein
VVAAEIERVGGRLTFDVGARQATADVSMVFTAGPNGRGPELLDNPGSSAGDGAVFAAFDLRQPLDSGLLDAEHLPAGGLSRIDLGGGPGAGMRVVGPFAPGSRHTLTLHYGLGTPDVTDALGVGWTDGGVRFDVWCSDLHPGRYLEQWLPVGLCQDRFALTLDVEILGAGAEHRVIANAAVDRTGDHRWSLAWPASYTSLSSLLVLAPATELDVATTVVNVGGAASSSPVTVEVTASTAGAAAAGTPDDSPGVEQLAQLIAGWLEGNATTIGSYIHGGRFVAHTWDHSRGMEYDGATTGSVAALEHEVFHSWFGRGVKPGSANDGWIDEAYTTWSTSSRPDFPRLTAAPFALDEAPVVLDPGHPWSRHTPTESYRTGYRVFAALADATGVDAVQSAMASYYRQRAGGFMTTATLQDHLSEALAVDVSPWWDRYVRGRA